MVNVTNWGELLSHTIDSYGKGNRNSSLVLDALNEGCGQAFISPLTLARLTDVTFLLQRNAAFVAPGTIEARLYPVFPGTVVGMTAVPNVAVLLATSDVVNAADIEMAWGLVNFHFSTPYTLDPNRGYVIVLVVTNCPAGGQVEVGIDATVLPTHFPMHPGNETDNTSPLFPLWTPNPLNDCIFYLFSYSDVLAGGAVDVTDRAGRLLGITEDTGVNTNPERWLHDNHWELDAEIEIAVADTDENVGGAVPAGLTRRIREITIRHEGSANTVVTLFDAAAGNIKLSIDVTAQSTVTWSSQDGREIAATLQPVIQTSDITEGSTFVSLAGVEA